MVDHEMLMAKLKVSSMTESASKWFYSYFSNRRQIFTDEGQDSSCLNVSYGVPWGSILGSLLFIIFVNDVPCSVVT